MKPLAKIVTILIVIMFAVAALPLVDLTEASGVGTRMPIALWHKTYSSNGAYDAIQTSDGGYAITSPGATGYQLVKFDSAGDVQWSESYSCPSYGVYPKSLVQTTDGGYAIVGWATSPANGYTGHVWLVKTDSDGTIQWDKILGDDQGVSEGNSLIQTSDGGYAITGDYAGFTGYAGPGGWNYLLMKTDSEGNLKWTKIFGGPNDDRGEAIVQTSEGGYALAGCTSIPGNTPQYGLAKTDSEGNLQWNQSYSESIWDWAYGLTTTSDGGYALVGTAGNSLGSGGSLWIVKADSKGTMQWDKNLGSNMGWGSSIIQTMDGGFAVSGGEEFQLAKTDANGNLQWTYNNTSGGIACSVVQTVDGKFFIAGEGSPWIAKISDGTVIAETSPTPQPTEAPSTSDTTIQFTCQSSVSTNIRVNIKGSLTSAGIGISNASILLSYSINNGAHWNEFTAVNTDDNGFFNVLWTPSATGNYLINATWLGSSNQTVATVVSLAITPFDSQSLFSVTSNSTLSGLSFDSASKQLTFSVSGPTGTTGYFDIYIPKSLINDISGLQLKLDGNLVAYDSQSQGDSWLVSFAYHHSSHHVTINLDTQQDISTHEFSNQWVVVLAVAVIAALVTIGVLLLKRKGANR